VYYNTTYKQTNKVGNCSPFKELYWLNVRFGFWLSTTFFFTKTCQIVFISFSSEFIETRSACKHIFTRSLAYHTWYQSPYFSQIHSVVTYMKEDLPLIVSIKLELSLWFTHKNSSLMDMDFIDYLVSTLPDKVWSCRLMVS